MSAQTADDRPESGDDSAPVVINGGIAQRLPERRRTTKQSSATTPATPTSTGSGDDAGSSEPASGSPTSKPSGVPSSASTRRWRQPKNVRDFAGQVNAVATMVLNGTMNVDTARTYSSVARTVAQAMSIEVTKARFLKAEPDLAFPDDVFEDEDDGED